MKSAGRLRRFTASQTDKRAPWKLGASDHPNPHIVARQVWEKAGGSGAEQSVLRWFETKEFQGADLAERRRLAVSRMHTPLDPIRIRVEVRPTSRLLLGVGEGATASGAGLPLLLPSGLPFIPASSLRGVARRSSTLESPEEVTNLFGSGDKPGLVQILDGLPVGVVKLVEDVFTPHHATYHSGGKQPSGFDPPVPVAMLAISEGIFETWLLPGPGCSESDDLNKAAEALASALADEGLGAKTSSGYGYVTVTRTET